MKQELFSEPAHVKCTHRKKSSSVVACASSCAAALAAALEKLADQPQEGADPLAVESGTTEIELIEDLDSEQEEETKINDEKSCCRVPTIFSSLRHHNYRLLWLGNIISQSGDWMDQIAFSWLIWERTNSSGSFSLSHSSAGCLFSLTSITT